MLVTSAHGQRRVLVKNRRQFSKSPLTRAADFAVEMLEQRVMLSFTVTTLTDTTSSGSLRYAITQANTAGGDQTIEFAGSLSGSMSLTSQLPALTANITIEGPGASAVTINGEDHGSVFTIDSGVTAEIEGLTITGGDGSGGAIDNTGTLTLAESTITGNTVGGGVDNTGTLAISYSTLSDNTSDGNGGALYNDGGTATVTDSTISGNSAASYGGGIYNNSAGTMTITDSTVSGNSVDSGAYAAGGGINNYGSMTIVNSTICGNYAIYGGGVANEGTLTITDSTISQNTGVASAGGIDTETDATLNGTIVAANNNGDLTEWDPAIFTGSYDLIGDGSASGSLTSSQLGSSGDLLDPKLTSLGDYGGPTETMALLNGSPANAAGAVFSASDGLDERGVARPSDAVGIGAYQSGTLVVNTLADPSSPTTGTLSFREAIADANALSGDQTIEFASGLSGSMSLTSQLPALTANITIEGPGASAVTINGEDHGSVFTIDSGVTAEIEGLTITGGDGSGGAIDNTGTLTLAESTITGNTVGGGVDNTGTLAISYSTLSDNTSDGNGGALYNDGGTATVTDSTISGNSAASYGGGIYNNSAGTMTITDSTVSGNSVDASGSSAGGGINNCGSMTIVNSTIYGNYADYGGGIANEGALTITDSTISQNTGVASAGGIDTETDATLDGTIVAANNNGDLTEWDPAIFTGSYDLIGDGSASGSLTSSQPGSSGDLLDPNLGALANNGGPTMTMLPEDDSPAIGNGAVFSVAGGVDQRGDSRPSSGIDIGAVQVPLSAPTDLSVTAGNAQNVLDWDSVAGATSYNVYRSTTSGGEGSTPIETGVSGTSFTDTGLTNGTTYYYEVTAVNGGEESSPSGEASGAPAASGDSLPYSDDFNRSDSSGLGDGWSLASGSFGITSDQAVSGSLGDASNDIALLSGVSQADVKISADIDATGMGPFDNAGLVARVNGNTYYSGIISNYYGSYSAQIYSVVDGSATLLASDSISSGSGTLTFEVIGSSLGLYFNGVLTASVEDSTITAAGSVGLTTSNSNGKFDNFSAIAESHSPEDVDLPFSDSFDRDDSPYIGDDWTVQQGDFALSSDQIVSTASGDGEVSLATVNGVSAADVQILADIDVTNTGPFGWGGVGARLSDSSGYIARLRRDYSDVYAEICADVDGTWTTLDSEQVSTDSGTVELEVVGSSITMYLNGKLVAGAVDSSITGAGTIGIYSNDASVTFANFSANAAEAASPEDVDLPFTDAFDRDSSSLLGSSWTENEGEFAISDQSLTNVVTDVSSISLNGVSEADIAIGADVDLTNAADGATVGLDARVNGDTEYRGQIRKSGSSYYAEILRDDDGTWTTLDSNYALAGSGTLYFELEGSTLTLYLNGVPSATATDSTYTAAGGAGLTIDAGDSTKSITIDNFTAAVPSTPSPEDASLPFTENFDIAEDSPIPAYWTQEEGNFAVGDDALWSLIGAESEASLNGVSAADVSASGDIDLSQTGVGGTVGFDLRVSGDTLYRGEFVNYYGTYTAEILKEVDGVWTTLDERTFSWPLVNGRPSSVGAGQLTFDIAGSQLGLYFGDSLVASAVDDSITSAGGIGLYASNSCSFNNLSFSVLTPASPEDATAPFSDDFNRADNAIQLGAYWTSQAGDYAVLEDQAVAMSSGNSLETVNGISEADVVLSANVNVPASQAVGLIARYAGSGDANYYLGEISDGTAQIVKNIDGTQTVLASATAPGTSGTLRFEVNGDLLQLFFNGNLVTSVEDDSITAAGLVGCFGATDPVSGYSQGTLTDFSVQLPSSVSNVWLTIPSNSGGVAQDWNPGVAVTHAVVGDFTGDGEDDVAGYDSSTGNWIVGESQGTAGFTNSVWATWDASATWSDVIVGDFNGDGLDDIAARRASDGAWFVAISNGTSFTTTEWASSSTAADWTDVMVGDVNGDRRADLIGFDPSTGQWTAAVSSGTSFAISSWANWGDSATWENAVVGDFNGDGRTDVAAYDASTGDWHVGVSSSSAFANKVWATWDSDVDWQDVLVGDFNGDGFDDIIGRASGSEDWEVALSTGAGQTFSDSTWTGAADLVNVQVGDFNGDGKSDLIGQISGTRDWHVELSSGSGFTDQYWTTFSSALSPDGTLVGNFYDLQAAAANAFQWVYNNVDYSPYSGMMKGPEATRETESGNDWDQDAMLSSMLNDLGIQTQYVSGTVQIPLAEVENWLGVKDETAAYNVLNTAGLDPTDINSGEPDEALQFAHTWIEAYLPGPDGLQWTAMDPSFKLHNLQAGIGGLSSSIPFDETGYLSTETTESPYEYYGDEVAAYLAANDPGQSIADVPYTGPIIAQSFTSIPSSLPFTVIGDTTTYTAVPDIEKDRVELVLEDDLDGGDWGTLLDYTVNVPDVALDSIDLTYTQDSSGNYMPEIRINGQIVDASTQGFSATGADQMELIIEHYDPGSDTVSSSTTYLQQPGTAIDIGLDADQYSNASIAAQQALVNTESLAVENGDTGETQAAFDDGLSLAMMEYIKTTDQDEADIAGLNNVLALHTAVGDGVIDADPSEIQYNWGSDVPIASADAEFDIQGSAPGRILATNGADGQYDDRLATLRLLGLNNSFLESDTLASVFNADSLSAVAGIQWANDNGIPVLTIDSANESTELPELSISSAALTYVEDAVSAGYTVTVPSETLNLTSWSGSVFLEEEITDSSYAQGDAVIGNYVTHGAIILDFYRDPNYANGAANTNQSQSGDPVNTATGTFNRDDTDVSMPNIGIPLTFERWYVSGSTTDVGLGEGWTDTYSDTMTTQEDGDVLWTTNQGYQYTFTPNGDGGYTNPAGLFGTLTINDDGYTWCDTLGNQRIFNSAGQLTELEDPNGNSLLIAYDDAGNLASVTDGDDSSRKLTFTSTDGHITSMTDFTGRTWTYSYETETAPGTDETVELLTSRTTPSDDSTPAETLDYSYNTSGALFGLMSAVTDSTDDTSIQVGYYPNGRVFSVTDPDGNTENFYYNFADSSATYVNALGQAQIDEFDDEGDTIKQINPDQTRISYVWSDDLLQSETDEIGRTETFQYDDNGNLTKFVSFDGVETDASYDPTLNRPTSVTLSGGGITTYGYDADGNVTSVTDAMGDETTMTYNDLGELLTLTKPDGNVEDPSGDYTTTYTYNDAGQMLTETTGLPSTITNTYDDQGDLTSVTDADGNTTNYEYDILDRLIQTTGPDPDGSGPEAAAVSTTSYDLADDEVTDTDPLGYQTTTVTDGDDNVVEVMNADGSVEKNTYDAVGNLVSSSDADGRITQYIYDSSNRLIETILPDGSYSLILYNGDGQVVESIDPNGNKTTYTYNGYGELVSVTNALDQTTSYTYDSMGNVATETDPSGTATYTRDLLGRVTQTRAPGNVITTTDYDADGNVVKQTLYDVSGLETIPDDPRTLSSDRQESTTTTYDVLDRPIEVTDAAGNETSTTYDAAGNVVSTTDALGNTTTYAYDDAGRLISITGADPDGSGPEEAPVTQFEYNADGEKTAEIDPLGNETTYAYDSMGDLTSVTSPDPDGSGPLTAPVTTYQYDPAGQEVSTTDADGNTTYYTYNIDGEVSSQIQSAGSGTAATDGDESIWTYGYDPNGNLISQTDADGRTTQYVYNALNQVTAENWMDSNGVTVDYAIDYTYNDEDQLSSVSDPDSTYSYTYTDAGQVASVDNSGTPNVPDVVLNYAYDGFGNESSLSASVGGSAVLTNTYLYNPLDEVTSETQSGTVAADKQAAFTYDADGNLTGLNLYASLDTSSPVASAAYVYDADNNPTSLVYSNGDGTSTLATYSYTYNADGQITGVTSVDGSATYSYDADGQLVSASGSALPASESYSYDASGNPANSGDVTGPYNQIASDGTYDYAYDGDGNLITKTTIATGATENFTWDYRNRLTDVTYKNAEGTTTEHIHYTYDAYNQLISTQVDSDGGGTYDSSESDIRAGGQLVMSLSGGTGGSVTHVYLYGPGATAPLADDATSGGGSVSWLLSDVQGNVRDVIDSGGTVLDHIVYDSYGNVLSQSDSSNQPRFGFAGMELDALSGLYYDHARYYNPGTGTFISQDPSGFAGGNANLYGYVNNDPVNLIDPTGLTPKDASNYLHGLGNGVAASVALIGLGIIFPEFGLLLLAGGVLFTEANLVKDFAHGDTVAHALEDTAANVSGYNAIHVALYGTDAFGNVSTASPYAQGFGGGMAIGQLAGLGLGANGALDGIGAEAGTGAWEPALPAEGDAFETAVEEQAYDNPSYAGGDEPADADSESAAESGPLASYSGGLSESAGSVTREGIVNGLTGFTDQGNAISASINSGATGLNVLGDNLFEQAYALKGGVGEVPQAFAYGEQIYVRQSSANLLSDVVHEGTHALDYLNGFDGSTIQLEQNAYSAERAFQQAGGGTVEFKTEQEMQDFINQNYKN